MTKQVLFSKLQEVVVKLKSLDYSVNLMDFPHGEDSLLRLSVNSHCSFLGSDAVSYLSSIGYPFAIDVCEGVFCFCFYYDDIK